MTPTLTDTQKIRRLPWLLAHVTLNDFFIHLVVFGSTLIMFLDALGMDKTRIGIIISLMRNPPSRLNSFSPTAPLHGLIKLREVSTLLTTKTIKNTQAVNRSETVSEEPWHPRKEFKPMPNCVGEHQDWRCNI